MIHLTHGEPWEMYKNLLQDLTLKMWCKGKTINKNNKELVVVLNFVPEFLTKFFK